MYKDKDKEQQTKPIKFRKVVNGDKITLEYHFDGQKSTAVSKSFIRKLRKKLLIDILIKIFESEQDVLNLNKPELIDRIFQYLGKYSKKRKSCLNILEQEEINKMAYELLTMDNIESLFYDRLCTDDYHVQSDDTMSLIEILVFDDNFITLLNKIWDDLCNLLINLKTDTSWEYLYCNYIQQYPYNKYFKSFEKKYSQTQLI